MVNYSNYREAFHHLAVEMAHPVYVAFFTLAGAKMALDALPLMLPVATLLFTVRIVAVMAGTQLGGRLCRMPQQHTNYAWMALITQAGVTLGLAQQVAAQFSWGPPFATAIIGAVVLNQFVGPPLMKYAISVRTGRPAPRWSQLSGAAPCAPLPLPCAGVRGGPVEGGHPRRPRGDDA